jgi:hypothetical protein
VLDQHRRYLGLIDLQSLVIYALKAFDILNPAERAKSLHEIALESAAMMSDAPGGADDAQQVLEGAAAAGPTEGAKIVRALGQPVFVPGGANEFAGRSVKAPTRAVWSSPGDLFPVDVDRLLFVSSPLSARFGKQARSRIVMSGRRAGSVAHSRKHVRVM